MKTFPPTGTETRILLVDHETSTSEELARILETEGLQAVVATNRHEALETIRQSPVALVIMNMLMPRAEGIGTLVAIQGLIPGMKIIAMSSGHGEASTGILPLAKSLGASALLSDPLDSAKLLDTVHGVLEQDLHQLAS